ncbi:MAG: hypothetical protein ACYC4I_02000 [Minisyncoccota bacterium]
MPTDFYLLIVLVFALGGTIFSGYLSIVRVVTKQCPPDEPCALFLSLPACWFGFVIFLGILGTVSFALLGYLSIGSAKNIMLAASAAGTLFAGYLMVQEIIIYIRSKTMHYSFLLPACVYSLMFYIAIFLLSLAY